MFDLNPNPLIHTPVSALTDEQREDAKKRTISMIRELDGMRKQLELPIEQLPMVREIYMQKLVEAVVESERKAREERTCRVPMTFRSRNDMYQPLKVLPGKLAVIVERPQWLSFRVEDIEIHGDRSRWKIHDIKVGNKSQFANRVTPATGTAFGPGGVLANLKLEACPMALDISIVVEYVGPEAEGEVFEATVAGLAVEDC